MIAISTLPAMDRHVQPVENTVKVMKATIIKKTARDPFVCGKKSISDTKFLTVDMREASRLNPENADNLFLRVVGGTCGSLERAFLTTQFKHRFVE